MLYFLSGSIFLKILQHCGDQKRRLFSKYLLSPDLCAQCRAGDTHRGA